MNTAVKAAIISVVIFGATVAAILVLQPGGGKAPPRENDVARGPGGDVPGPRGDADGTKSPLQPLPPREPVEVRVEVREKGSGRPLSYARVAVLRRSEPSGSGQLVRELGDPSAGGIYKLELEPGNYEVRAQCRNYKGEKRTLTLIKDAAPQSLVLELERGNTISGRVLARGGTPIAGARVFALQDLASRDADLEDTLRRIVDLEEMSKMVHPDAITGADGRYVIGGLESYWYTVRATAQGYTPNEIENVLAPKDGVDLVLEEGAVLEGLVQDTTGRSIEGAVVQAYPELEGAGIFAVILSKSRPPVDEAKTDSGGYFKLDKLGGGLYNFIVEAPGHQQYTEMKYQMSAGAKRTKNFTLKPGHVIRGVVRGPEDEPVSGARVRASQIGGVQRHDQVRIRFEDGSVVTDEQGTFLFDTVSDANFMLIAWHEDYQSVQRKNVRPTGEEIILKLSHGTRLFGVVADARTGNPVPGAMVSVSDLANLRKEGVTDEQGVYFVPGLGGNRRSVSVLVKAPGYARAKQTLKVRESEELELDFELQPTGIVEGVVVDSAGKGMGGVRIEVKRVQEDSGTEQIVGHGKTASDGSYSIDDVEPGSTLKVRAKASAYLTTFSEPFSLEPGETATVDRIVLELGGMIQGVVVTDAGAPVNGCMVAVEKEGEGKYSGTGTTVQTNPKGEFEIKGLQAGFVDLKAKANNFLEGVQERVQVKEGQINYGIKIVLAAGGVLEGVVVDAAGEPVKGAEVLVGDYSDRGAKEHRAVTHPDGRFRVSSIASKDAVEIEVNHDDYGPYTQPDVPVGTVDLQIVLQPLGRIRGVVLGPDGEAVQAFSAQPRPQSGMRLKRPLRPKTFNTGDGSFEYTGVPDGVYTVSVRSPRFAASSIEDVQVRAGETVDLGRILLQEGGTVSGRVVDASNGGGIPGAEVRVRGGASRFQQSGARSLVKTQQDGAFAFQGLKDGSLTIEVSHEAYVKKTVRTRVPDQSQGLVVEMETGAEIMGQVVDLDGNPRQGISVYLMSRDGKAKNNRTAKSDTDGNFAFVGISPGNYRVRAHKFPVGGQPALTAETEVDVAAGGRQEIFLRLESR